MRTMTTESVDTFYLPINSVRVYGISCHLVAPSRGYKNLALWKRNIKPDKVAFRWKMRVRDTFRSHCISIINKLNIKINFH